MKTYSMYYFNLLVLNLLNVFFLQYTSLQFFSFQQVEKKLFVYVLNALPHKYYVTFYTHIAVVVFLTVPDLISKIHLKNLIKLQLNISYFIINNNKHLL